MPTLDFWYEFASTYSYPAALCVSANARSKGVRVNWRPILLGPIFAAQGWSDSPFNLFPAKGRYMWRDMERICAAHDLPFKRPKPFPQKSLVAARVATVLEGEERADFSRRVYQAQFGEGRSIETSEFCGDILRAMGGRTEEILQKAQSEAVKAQLKTETEAAVRAGVFGAPSFTTACGELFWGFDRMERAIAWSLSEKGPHT